MELYRDPFSLRAALPGSTLSIGNFDGVHVGHQAIFARVVDAARADGAKAVVFTFEPHPAAILHPDRAPDRILAFDHKLALLDELGIDAVICPDGPLNVLALSAEQFTRRIIVEGIGAARLVEGPNFVFGSDRLGAEDLRQRSPEELGFQLEIVPAVVLDGEPVSSTRIRRLVREGRVAPARRLLGRPFEFVGQVVHGRHRGTGLGYPTVNLAGGDFLIPGDGVYAGRATIIDIGNEMDAAVTATGQRPTYGAAISVGRAETFERLPQSVVEAYLLDADVDLYGRTVRLEFLEHLRPQQVFADAEALAEQMGRDCQAVREVLAHEWSGRAGT